MSIMVMLLQLLLLLGNSSLHALAAPTSKPLTRRGAPILSGSPVVFGAGTYPRANRLSDGSLLGVYTAFSGGNNIITTTKSTDNGATWTNLGTVTQGSSNANDIDNPYVLQLPTGRVLCAFRNHSKDPSTGAYTFFRITVTYSDDQGSTWAYLSTASSDPGPVNGNWEPFLRLAEDGSLQIYYSRENSAADQDTIERFSTDGGKTWTSPTTISGAGITSRDGMTGVTTISGSKLIAVFESEQNGIFSIMSITSADDGVSWSTTRNQVYAASGTSNSAGAPQIINVDGTLIVSFMTSEDANLGSSGGAYTSHTAAKVVTSTDGGNTWGNKLTVSPEQSFWPGLVVVDQQSFLALVDHGGAKAQKVNL